MIQVPEDRLVWGRYVCWPQCPPSLPARKTWPSNQAFLTPLTVFKCFPMSSCPVLDLTLESGVVVTRCDR